eukprot:scaffold338_cov231-Chaetoceros_neogracile.AAC.9
MTIIHNHYSRIPSEYQCRLSPNHYFPFITTVRVGGCQVVFYNGLLLQNLEKSRNEHTRRQGVTVLPLPKASMWTALNRISQRLESQTLESSPCIIVGLGIVKSL